MNRGGLGARALNFELQRVLNPPDENAIQRFGWTFGAGDKVMQVENDYEKEVYNGDLGFVRTIDPEAGEVLVEFDGREVMLRRNLLYTGVTRGRRLVVIVGAGQGRWNRGSRWSVASTLVEAQGVARPLPIDQDGRRQGEIAEAKARTSQYERITGTTFVFALLR
jgi:ATP-dependent exoDNAse (exonuclease V) alpha subunit